MDLRKHQITIGELLDDPGSRAVLTKQFPFAFKKPLTGAAKTVRLDQLIALAGGFLSPRKLAETLQALEKV